jgi:hypothetical protein
MVNLFQDKTKKILSALLILSCNSQTPVVENNFSATENDTIKIDFDPNQIYLTDSFVRQPNGEEQAFRQIILTNKLPKEIYIEKQTLTHKIIYGELKEGYHKKREEWFRNFIDNWGTKDLGYYELKPETSDTFLISDPFINGDSIIYNFKFFIDTLTKESIEIEEFYVLDNDRNIKKRNR